MKKITKVFIGYIIATYMSIASLSSSTNTPNPKIHPLSQQTSTVTLTQNKETQTQNEYPSKYKTIAHKFLDLEVEAGLEANFSDYKTLDGLIDKATERIEIKSSYTKENAIKILKEISLVLKEEGFENHKSKEGISLLNEGLKKKELDCDTYSIIYLGIAEVLDLPLSIVTGSAHVFLRWHLNEKEYFNWETTSARNRSDLYYKKWLNISKESINNGAYLQSLNKQEVLAIEYMLLGVCSNNPDKAIKEISKSIALNPKYPLAYYNRADIFYRNNEIDKAIKDYSIAIKLDPNFFSAYYDRGFTFAKKGELDKAIKDYSTAIKLNPKNKAIYLNRAHALKQKGKIKKAEKDFWKYKELSAEELTKEVKDLQGL